MGRRARFLRANARTSTLESIGPTDETACCEDSQSEQLANLATVNSIECSREGRVGAELRVQRIVHALLGMQRSFRIDGHPRSLVS